MTMTHKNHQKAKITIRLTKEQGEFLTWAAKLEGITSQEYLLRAARGKLIRNGDLKPKDDEE
jgi:uncharacterized protein (DUF1778 family)